MSRFLSAFAIVFLTALLPLAVAGQTPKESPKQTPAADLSEFCALDKAITAKITSTNPVRVRAAGYLGIHVRGDGQELTITEVQFGSPAGQTGIKTGDVLLKIDGNALTTPDALREFLQSKDAGDKVAVTYRRQKETLQATVTMAATSRPISGVSVGKQPVGKGPPPDTPLALWKKDLYRLAVVIIEFADIKHNEKIGISTWEEALFSEKKYVKKSATGQQVHGSLNDYFQEQSYGKFRVEGKVFAPVQVSKKRADYVQGSGTTNKTAVLSEALAKLEGRETKDALNGYDGICFIYGGARVQSNAGSVYYPQQGTLTVQGKRWPFILCPEGGSSMETISVFALEFGKLLGLPHLAARPESAGSEGLGVWCLMSNGAGQNGKPLHLSAWCKEQLGWLTPTVVEPTTKQKLILAPVAKSPKECLKVLVRFDGSEYFLLENRSAKGFDSDLPGQGLLIWRVVGGRPVLEEAHGVTGPSGPRVHLSSVPYPSKANNSFTPTTTPSSRPVAGGGLPVHITNIRRLEDGRITLFLGYEYH